MIQPELISHCLIFRHRGRDVARGISGARYIIPAAWTIHYAPAFTKHDHNQRWLRYWRTLPLLEDYSWVSSFLSTGPYTAHGLTLTPVFQPRPELPRPRSLIDSACLTL